MERKKKTALKYRILRLLLILVIFAGTALYIYGEDYYRPSANAQAAMATGEGITFTREGKDLVFTPENPLGGVVIYPGGKVSEEAYARLAREIAKEGYKTVVVSAPLKLPILRTNAAKRYVEEEGIEDWVILGHSLGGVTAARFAKKNPDKIRALVLLAAYPDKSTDLGEVSFPVYSLVGTKDQILDQASYAEGLQRLPVEAKEILIPGGNHSSFANYGLQDGDALADLSYAEQQQVILDLLPQIFDEIIR